MCGSVLETVPGELMRWFQPFDMPRGEGLLHTTLSMPSDRILTDSEWHDVSKFVLERSGVPPDLAAWFAWGREVSRCDHLHIISGCQTWSGRPFDIQTSVRATDALAVDLAHRLNISEPHWSPSGTRELISHIRGGAHPDAREFGDDINRAFGTLLPTSVTALDDALVATGSWWRIGMSPTSTDQLIPIHSQTGERINPKNAGVDFSSARLFQRLRLASIVRVRHAVTFLRQLVCVMRPDDIPLLRKATHNDHNEHRYGRAGSQDRHDEGGCPTAIASPRPSGACKSRPNGQLRRKTDQLYERDRGELQRPDGPVFSASVRNHGAENGSRNNTKTPELLSGGRVARGSWLLRFLQLANRLKLEISHRFDFDDGNLHLSFYEDVETTFDVAGLRFTAMGKNRPQFLDEFLDQSQSLYGTEEDLALITELDFER